MATKKVGDLIKEARTGAGLTQAQLAAKVDGVTASDISKAERGEKELTQAQLRQIAKERELMKELGIPEEQSQQEKDEDGSEE